MEFRILAYCRPSCVIRPDKKKKKSNFGSAIKEVIETSGGGKIVSIMFGQGLTEQTDDEGFRSSISAVSPGTQISRSLSTYASEEAGLGPNDPGCAQQ